MNNNNGFGSSPIRSYKKQNQPNPLRTAAVLIMTVIIIAFVAVLIMSLTGTGMFADKKETEPPDIGTTPPSDSTDTPNADTTEGEETTDGSTEDPNAIKYVFTNKGKTDLELGLLQLINEKYLYKFKEDDIRDSLYTNRPTYKSYQLANASLELKFNAIAALNQMMDDFYLVTGYKYLNINKAYYDFDSQKALFEKELTDTPPGASDWHSGATFRFNAYDFDSGKTLNINNVEEVKWLKEHAHEYGFIFRAPTHKKSIVGYAEPWQLRYVGCPHAEYMYENDLCLEEYLEKLSKDFKYGTNHLKLESADGNSYEVYYIAYPEEGLVKVPVPSNRPYTVSGDNIGGFIVTVKTEEGERAPLETPAPDTSDPDTTDAEVTE